MTLALTIVRGLQPIILAPLYVFAQLLGGIIGAALAKVNILVHCSCLHDNKGAYIYASSLYSICKKS